MVTLGHNRKYQNFEKKVICVILRIRTEECDKGEVKKGKLKIRHIKA